MPRMLTLNPMLTCLRSPNNPNFVRSITRHKQSALIIKRHISRTEASVRTVCVIRVAHDIDGRLI